MVLAAEGRKANDSHADCYQYFCGPEYGTANGRVHFHAVHFMRRLLFFSSRRRHTRCDCDWSSDVCSSDLISPKECVWTAPSLTGGAWQPTNLEFGLDVPLWHRLFGGWTRSYGLLTSWRPI